MKLKRVKTHTGFNHVHICLDCKRENKVNPYATGEWAHSDTGPFENKECRNDLHRECPDHSERPEAG
jgi:hypothetical protein